MTDWAVRSVEDRILEPSCGEAAFLLAAVDRLAALEATGIRLHGQVAPGVPLGELVGGWAAGLSIATKAGGFGNADVLITASEAVRLDRSTP